MCAPPKPNEPETDKTAHTDYSGGAVLVTCLARLGCVHVLPRSVQSGVLWVWGSGRSARVSVVVGRAVAWGGGDGGLRTDTLVQLAGEVRVAAPEDRRGRPSHGVWTLPWAHTPRKVSTRPGYMVCGAARTPGRPASGRRRCTTRLISARLKPSPRKPSAESPGARARRPPRHPWQRHPRRFRGTVSARVKRPVPTARLPRATQRSPPRRMVPC